MTVSFTFSTIEGCWLIWTDDQGMQYCLLVARDGTCHPGVPYTVPGGQYGTIDVFYTTSDQSVSPLLLGNGPCGAIYNGGDNSPSAN